MPLGNVEMSYEVLAYTRGFAALKLECNDADEDSDVDKVADDMTTSRRPIK